MAGPRDDPGKRGGRGGGGGGGHDSAGGMRWLLTYADMITLLLALFIYLFSISTVDTARLKAFSSAFMELFGIGESPVPGSKGVLPIPGTDGGTARRPDIQRGPGEAAGQEAGEQRTRLLRRFREDLEKRFPDLIAQGRLAVIEQPDGLVLRLADTTLFDRGSADVIPAALEVLDAVTAYLRQLPNPIRVEGHTDDLPLHGGRYRSNWELSGARAASVLMELAGRGGIRPDRLSLAGYGEFRPVAPNTPGQGNAANRRVEILVLPMPAAPAADAVPAESE